MRSVTLNTDGSVRVNGVIDYANAGANDSLTINAGETIAIDTDTGGIQITNPAGDPDGDAHARGRQHLGRQRNAARSAFGNPNFEGRSAALAVNSGTPNQDGFVRAGTVHAAVGHTLFVRTAARRNCSVASIPAMVASRSRARATARPRSSHSAARPIPTGPC